MNTLKKRYDWLRINKFELKKDMYIFWDSPGTSYKIDAFCVEYYDDEQWEIFVQSYHDWIGQN